MYPTGKPNPLRVVRGSIVAYAPQRARTAAATTVPANTGTRVFAKAKAGAGDESKEVPSPGRTDSSYSSMIAELRIKPTRTLVHETGVPPSEYASAYELAYNEPASIAKLSITTPESLSTLFATFTQGIQLRNEMMGYCSVEKTDTNTASLCLRHLMNLQLCLHGLSGGLIDDIDTARVKNVVTELKKLQKVLKDREIILPIDEKPSLSLALTHLCLGSVTLTLRKLKENFPIAYPEDSADTDYTTSSSNPLHRAGMRKKFVVVEKDISASALADLDKLSILRGIFQTATDYLALHNCTHSLFKSFDWVNTAIKTLEDDPEREDSSSLLELLIRHRRKGARVKSVDILIILEPLTF